MMKKYKWLILSGVLLTFLYFASRLPNLTTLPIFTDEAIYIRWAQIAKQDASWRFISLTDGKQPLFVWGVMVMLRFVQDPLMAGRLVSVFSGFFTLIGIGLLTWELFKSKRPGLFASILYLISPFSLMYDRMALMDAMTATFYIWSLYFGVLLVRTLRLDVALILGMILGGGVLTKTSGFLNIYLLPTTLVLFDWKKEKRLYRLLKWGGLALLAIIFSQMYYSVLRLSPWFHMIGQKDTTFVYPFNEWFEHPLRFLRGNLHGEFDWLKTYLTWPIMLLIFSSLVTIQKTLREKTLLFIWFFAPFVALALFGKVLYPRFILFMSMPLLVLAAWSVEHIRGASLRGRQWGNVAMKKFLLFTFYFLLFTYPLYVDTKILFSIVTAPIPYSDSGQYINDWPAGWGIREVVSILKKEAQDKKITVYTEGNFGLLPAGLEIYLVRNSNIEIIGLWPVPKELTREMLEKIGEKPVYYVSNQFQELPERWKTKLIAGYQKGTRTDRHFRLFRVLGVRNEFE